MIRRPQTLGRPPGAPALAGGELGDTWRILYGSRAGMQVGLARHGGPPSYGYRPSAVEPVVKATTWSSLEVELGVPVATSSAIESTASEAVGALGEGWWEKYVDLQKTWNPLFSWPAMIARQSRANQAEIEKLTGAAKKKGVATGTYAERDEWVYHWNAKSAAIQLMVTPSSITPKRVEGGSKAWTAILNAIVNGKARKIDAEELKAIKSKWRREREDAGRGTVQTFTEGAKETAEKLTDAAAGKSDWEIPGWAPWAVGGVLIISALGIVLAGSRRPATPAVVYAGGS